ncbi:MAG: hypothetical protein ACYTAS_05750, partial [Planctomycetota bacterium]
MAPRSSITSVSKGSWRWRSDRPARVACLLQFSLVLVLAFSWWSGGRGCLAQSEAMATAGNALSA